HEEAQRTARVVHQGLWHERRRLAHRRTAGPLSRRAHGRSDAGQDAQRSGRLIVERTDTILVVAPFGRDADLICTQMRANGVNCEKCDSVEEVCARVPNENIAAIVMTEEALNAEATGRL